MKRVTVEAWCDGYIRPHDHEVGPTVERTMRVGDFEFVVDLCAECDLMLQAFQDRGAEVNHKPPSRSRAGIGGRPQQNLPRVCPDCGHETPTRSALGTHVKARHDKRLRDYDWST